MADSLLALAAKHYENFPVGSLLIPKKERVPIRLIYAYARVADDLADEGMAAPDERIARLNEWEGLLHDAIRGEPTGDYFRNLAEVITRFELPERLFSDLISAFRKDARNPVYNTFNEILEYCTYSANPIGRLMLKIFKCSNEETERLSDDICTALQLTNLWQDISVDTRRNRFYIAREEFERCHFTVSDLRIGTKGERFIELMRQKVQWTKMLFLSGKPLLSLIGRRDFRLELKMTWHGGMRILEKIEQQQYDTRYRRPTLGKKDKLIIAARTMMS